MKLFKYLILFITISTSGYILSQHKGEKYTLESIEGSNEATIVKTSGALGGGHKANVLKIKGNVIDTSKNEVGIEKDICAVSRSGKLIVCKSGKVFNDVCKTEGSATGTPPWLSGEPNYIGQRILKSSSGKAGGTKRVAYFECSMHITEEHEIS